MAKCWTCRRATRWPCYSCEACKEILEEVRANVEGLKDLEVATTDVGEEIGGVRESFEDGVEEIIEALQDFEASVETRLDWIGAVVAEGVDQLEWEMARQTSILRSIDETLKLRRETQANELRAKGEEALSRQVPQIAEQMFRESLAQNPLDYRAYLGFARSLLQQDKVSEARNTWKDSLPHAPSGFIRPLPVSREHPYPDEYRPVSYSHFLIGRSYEVEDEWDEADSEYRKALEVSPHFSHAHFHLALVRLTNGEGEEGLRLIDRALRLNPLYCALLSRNLPRELKQHKTDVANSLADLRSEQKAKLGYFDQKATNTWQAVRRANQKSIQALSPFEEQPELSSSKFLSLYDEKADSSFGVDQSVSGTPYRELVEATAAAAREYSDAFRALIKASTEARVYGKCREEAEDDLAEAIEAVRWKWWEILLLVPAYVVSFVWSLSIGVIIGVVAGAVIIGLVVILVTDLPLPGVLGGGIGAVVGGVVSVVWWIGAMFGGTGTRESLRRRHFRKPSKKVSVHFSVEAEEALETVGKYAYCTLLSEAEMEDLSSKMLVAFGRCLESLRPDVRVRKYFREHSERLSGLRKEGKISVWERDCLDFRRRLVEREEYREPCMASEFVFGSSCGEELPEHWE